MPNDRGSDHSRVVFSALRLGAVLGVLLGPAFTRAAEAELPASNAQPGFYNVGIAEAPPPTVAATVGYGFTEAQSSSDGAHHRLSLQAAGALPVLPWLSVGPTVAARYDVHPNDSGAVIDGSLLARASGKVGAWQLGGELEGWVPGADDAKSMMKGFSLDARLLAGSKAGRVRLAGMTGYRLDRSAGSIENAAALAPGDRFALGVSDFDAVLIGVGSGVPIGTSELVGELSADVLVGKGAPDFRQSPFRLAAGFRNALSAQLSLELMAVASLSAKPKLDPSAPLVPNEPRLSVFGGIRYQFVPSAKPVQETRPPPPAPAPVVVAPVPAAPTEGAVEVGVIDEQGAPVKGAKAVLRAGTEPREIVCDDGGRCRAERAPAGNATVRVEAPGFEPAEQQITVRAGAPQNVEVRLVAVPPPSQIRGVVRSFDGKPLAARIRVEPLGVESHADSEGAFQIDLPPGSYEVVLEVDGYVTQRRRVQVDPQGVVVLNADLARKKR